MTLKNLRALLVIQFLFFLASCGKPTKACFTISPNPVSVNSTVTFDPSCSQNAGFYEWNFGDGSNDTTSTSSITHQFNSAGSFTVTLNASRKDGLTLGKDYPTKTEVITVQ